MSTLHVENLKGLSSGGNANKIIVPSGQTLTAPGHIVQYLDVHDNTSYVFSSNPTTNINLGLVKSICLIPNKLLSILAGLVESILL